MSGHGGFSSIGSGMKVPQPFNMPKIEELQPGKDGGPLGDQALPGGPLGDRALPADTRLDQTKRLAASLDVMLLKVAKTAAAPVDVQALKDTLVAAGLDKATRKALGPTDRRCPRQGRERPLRLGRE